MSDEPAGPPAREPLASDTSRDEPRTWLERLGMAGIAAVLAVLLFGMTVAAYAGGELILAAMSFSGAVLTSAVGLRTLLRG